MKKPNLNNLLKFDMRYMDISKLYTSPHYLSQLRKIVFAMIRQLGPPTFFVTYLVQKVNDHLYCNICMI